MVPGIPVLVHQAAIAVLHMAAVGFAFCVCVGEGVYVHMSHLGSRIQGHRYTILVHEVPVSQ